LYRRNHTPDDLIYDLWQVQNDLITGIESDETNRSSESFQTRIYPNPASNVITVDFVVETDSEVEFSLINRLGQTIAAKKKQFNAGWQREMIDIPKRIADGLYHLLIRYGSESRLVLFAIQR
jgi:hypothetical protein